MTKFTQGVALTQHVEAGGIRFAYRRLGVSERLPLFVRYARVFLDD